MLHGSVSSLLQFWLSHSGDSSDQEQFSLDEFAILVSLSMV